MSWRRLRVMIQHLPPESATMTALRNASPQRMESDADPAEGQWSQTQMLLALLVDEVRWLRWMTAAVNSEKGKAPERPEPVPRPGVEPGGKRHKPKLSDDQLDFLFRHINGLDTSDTGIHLQLINGGG